jgi:hypothetical protein
MLPDASDGDPEIALRKQQHRTNNERAYFWGKISQLAFWAMAATFAGGVFAAGAGAATGGFFAGVASMAGLPSLLVAAGMGVGFGVTSLVAGRIENRIRVDNSLNFEEIHAKNIGRHTGREVAQAIVNAVESRQTEQKTNPASSIPVGIARNGATPSPQTRIETQDASVQGRTASPANVTLH